jgi:hypothetical protein
MITIKRSEILREFDACPYCMNDAVDFMGCCGESADHYELAYETIDDVYLDHEVEIEEDEVRKV